MNALLRVSDCSRPNTVGKGLEVFLSLETLNFLGIHFPTYYDRNSTTTPDVILTSNKTIQDTKITQRPLTTTGHMPVIMELATKAITTP